MLMGPLLQSARALPVSATQWLVRVSPRLRKQTRAKWDRPPGWRASGRPADGMKPSTGAEGSGTDSPVRARPAVGTSGYRERGLPVRVRPQGQDAHLVLGPSDNNLKVASRIRGPPRGCSSYGYMQVPVPGGPPASPSRAKRILESSALFCSPKLECPAAIRLVPSGTRRRYPQ